MSLLWSLIVGAIIGAIAGAVTNKGNSMGWIANIVARFSRFFDWSEFIRTLGT